MNKILRVIFIGLVTGLGLFIITNLMQLLAAVVFPATATWGGDELLRSLTFALIADMITGVAYSAAFAPIQWGVPINRVYRGLLLALVIILIRVIPETLVVYNYFDNDLTSVALSAVTLSLGALVAGLFISAMYPFHPLAGRSNTDHS